MIKIKDTIEFRKDKFAGPSYDGVNLVEKGDNIYAGSEDGISYELRYRDESGVLCVEAVVMNTTDDAFILWSRFVYYYGNICQWQGE